MARSAIVLPSARPIRIVSSMAFWFGTGRLPGWPRHTGQVFVLGGEPNSLRHPQNIFVAVESSTWHSSPMTVSNSSVMRARRYRLSGVRREDREVASLQRLHGTEVAFVQREHTRGPQSLGQHDHRRVGDPHGEVSIRAQYVIELLQLGPRETFVLVHALREITNERELGCESDARRAHVL